MHNSSWNREPLTRLQLHGSILEIDQKFSFDDVEKLVQVIVLVPMIFTLHYAKSNDSVVHLAQRLVIPFVGIGVDQPLNVDYFKRRKENVQMRRVGIRLRRSHRRHRLGLRCPVDGLLPVERFVPVDFGRHLRIGKRQCA